MALRPGPFPGMWIDDQESGYGAALNRTDALHEQIAAQREAEARAAFQNRALDQQGRIADADRRAKLQMQAQGQVGDERMAAFQAGQRQQEQERQAQLEQQKMAQQNYQFGQGQQFDMLKEGARIWGEDADRAQRDQAQAQAAYQYEKTGQTQADQFGQAHAQSAYEFDRTDQRRAYEFDATQEQQRQQQQREAELRDWLSSREFGRHEEQRLTQLNEGLQAIMRNPNLEDWEKANAAMEYKTHIDPLEARRKNTEIRMRQQQLNDAKTHQDFQNQLLQEQAQREAMTQAAHARYNAAEFDHLQKTDKNGNHWVMSQYGKWEMVPDKSEKIAAMQAAQDDRREAAKLNAQKAIEADRAHAQKQVDDWAGSQEKAFNAAYQAEQQRQERGIANAEKQAANIDITDPDRERKQKDAADLAAKLREDMEKNIREELAKKPKWSAFGGDKDQFDSWLADQKEATLHRWMKSMGSPAQQEPQGGPANMTPPPVPDPNNPNVTWPPKREAGGYGGYPERPGSDFSQAEQQWMGDVQGVPQQQGPPQSPPPTPVQQGPPQQAVPQPVAAPVRDEMSSLPEPTRQLMEKAKLVQSLKPFSLGKPETMHPVQEKEVAMVADMVAASADPTDKNGWGRKAVEALQRTGGTMRMSDKERADFQEALAKIRGERKGPIKAKTLGVDEQGGFGVGIN